jgi:hypothetical protein
MGLLGIIRSGVKTADKLTKGLQPYFLYRQYLNQDGSGEKLYNPSIETPAVELRAIIEDKQEIVRTASGNLSQSKTHITVLDVGKLIAATSGLGIKESDLIILQNGETGIILSVGGFIDSGTGIPVATEIFLG